MNGPLKGRLDLAHSEEDNGEALTAQMGQTPLSPGLAYLQTRRLKIQAKQELNQRLTDACFSVEAGTNPFGVGSSPASPFLLPKLQLPISRRLPTGLSYYLKPLCPSFERESIEPMQNSLHWVFQSNFPALGHPIAFAHR